MAREKTVVRQAEVRVFATPNEECVVLVECKIASGLGSRNYMQSDTHCDDYREIPIFKLMAAGPQLPILHRISINADARKVTIHNTIPAMAIPRPAYLFGSESAFFIPR